MVKPLISRPLVLHVQTKITSDSSRKASRRHKSSQNVQAARVCIKEFFKFYQVTKALLVERKESEP